MILFSAGNKIQSVINLLPSGKLQQCQRSTSLSVRSFHKAYLERVTVIGGGHMGSGIAQISAAAGNFVTVADVNENALSKSRQRMEQRLVRFSKKLLKDDAEKIHKQVETVLSKIQFTTDIKNAVKQCDLVVEAIPEDIELKHKLFETIDKVAHEATIFVTNTSSIPVHELAQALSSKRKEQFAGTHFFEPVTVKLLEVVRIPETREEVFHKVMEWGRFIGKVPVVCKDSPGFIVNRLNIPYLINAVSMFERGDASYQDIDVAMKLGAGYPYGPFELADYVGLDVIYMILIGWERRFADVERFKCPNTIKEMYKQGRFGKKCGQGFYSY
ncbi:Hydroxyacyl-coenzyme A dehydrogenase, mitochondrial [Folsomia candida]|uniref:3-hydroxyacyl-CoA dehydrogenase n=2 Tax=Folsomia candida TaxID=158441 RepID=A0A226F0N4_FOLCA|nr:Hydroxyacyl-coenzyme A dehydrogenase, mitochondrial [Folsomia candida]